jgi:hypothetical protein
MILNWKNKREVKLLDVNTMKGVVQKPAVVVDYNKITVVDKNNSDL